MRTLISGILAFALYTLTIALLISMSIPTRSRIDAYIASARATTISVVPLPISGDAVEG